jgi:hypothetical protein
LLSCGSSFTPDTRVLLASGKAVPISSLKPGDIILATNTKTGKTSPETITAVEVNHDHDLYDLKVKTSGGISVIHATSNHLFWDPYLNQWVPAAKLKKGEHLKTANGTTATADGGSTPAIRDGWMWDLTIPGDGDHDFYVEVASASALVHNNACPVSGKPHGAMGEAATREWLELNGYSAITKEVQFRNSAGKAFRADWVALDPNDQWVAFDAKTGDGSVVSPNQMLGYPELSDFNAGVLLDTDKLADFGLYKGDIVSMRVEFDAWECPDCNP